jgi:DNA primase small subunit
MKLIEILEADFGFSKQELIVAFSGHRGYHVQVEAETIKTLDSMARREIADYLTGTGLEPTLHGVDTKACVGPDLEDVGWKGRIAKGTYELLASQEELEKAGLRKVSAAIASQGKVIQDRWKKKGPWGLVVGVGPEGWENIVEAAVEMQSVKIDTVVTADVHRLIRLANTIHGETGLRKVQISPSGIEQFDPFTSAVAFKQGFVTVDIAEAPEFRMEGANYGPFKNQRVELPTAAAMFLLCKGVAKTEEESAAVQ